MTAPSGRSCVGAGTEHRREGERQMTVIPIGRGRQRRPAGVVPSVAVTGSFRSTCGGSGAVAGSYRLERCFTAPGQTVVIGVFTVALTDADGTHLGTTVRRTAVATQVLPPDPSLQVRIGPLVIDLFGFLVTISALDVPVPKLVRARRRSGLPRLTGWCQAYGEPMSAPPRPLHDLLAERRLLDDVLALIGRCDGPPPSPLLDAVLQGAVSPLLPRQRGTGWELTPPCGDGAERPDV